MKEKEIIKKVIPIILFIILIIIFTYYEDDNTTIVNSNSPENTYVSGDINEAQKPKKLGKTDLKIYFIYVGQADCILVTDEDEVMLIDAGNNVDGPEVCKYIKSLGIDKIDYLIGTHPHEDHIGGVDDVIKQFEVSNLYMPDRKTTLRTYTDIEKAVSKKGLTIQTPSIGDKFNVGNAICEVMNIDSEAERLNDTSIVIELTYGKNKVLFTGDMEKLEEDSRSWNDVDILKVGHHGSYSSTGANFISQTKPEYAVIMAGKDNEYGYPHRETIEILNKNKVKIYRTDKDGTILVTSNGEELEFEKLDVNCDVIDNS